MTTLINEYSISYHRKRLKNFWKDWGFDMKPRRSINWWMGCMKLEPLKAGKQAKALVKDLIRMAVIEKKISVEEAIRLWDMVKSADDENQYLALSIIGIYYPRAFIKAK